MNNGTVDSAAWTAGVFNGTAPFNIGRLGGATVTYHDGSTDEVVFYKRILTAGERTWLYNGGNGRIYTDLTATTQGWYDNDYDYAGSQPHAVTGVTIDQSSVNSYQYDANGNMTCRTELGITYLQTYNTENRISSIAKLAGGDCAAPGNYSTKWDFTYDGDGTRTATLITPYDENGQPLTATLTRYYFGGALESSGDPESTSPTLKKYYSFAGQSVAMKEGTTFKYFLSDHLGSTSLVLSNTGSILEQQRYLPFGQPRAMSPAITSTDFTYTGQRALPDTGLMDYKARFYSPSLGRFIQPDTLIPGAANPQNWNRYSYTLNSPVNASDPTGHFPTPCFVCVIPDLIIEAVSALTGSGPDNIGLWKVQNYMSATKDPGNRKQDAMNTYTAAAIAIQSEFTDLGIQRDAYRSGRGMGQITNGEMSTAYGTKVDCEDCGYGLGMPGLNQNLPGVATFAMRTKLELTTGMCSKLAYECSATDVFIASSLTQAGPAFTKDDMRDLINGVYGQPNLVDPTNPNGATLAWDEYFNRNKSSNTSLPLGKFSIDVKELESSGWYVPDIDWEYIENLKGMR